MRVFFDTNVLLSAFATRGLCADLFRVVLAEHDLLVAEVVLAELGVVLKKKLRLPDARIRDIVDFLREYEPIGKPKRHPALALRDPDDEWIVASAVRGRAEVLVTGDQDLLSAPSPPLPALAPRDLWVRLRSGGRP